MTLTVDVATAAARLQELGCTEQQVERHVLQLSRLATKPPPEKPKPTRRPLPLFSPEATERIVARLSHGRWCRQWRRGGGDPTWAGVVIAAELKLDPLIYQDRLAASRVLRDLLDGGRLKLVPRRGNSGLPRLVEVAPPPVAQVPQPQPPPVVPAVAPAPAAPVAADEVRVRLTTRLRLVRRPSGDRSPDTGRNGVGSAQTAPGTPFGRWELPV